MEDIPLETLAVPMEGLEALEAVSGELRGDRLVVLDAIGRFAKINI